MIELSNEWEAFYLKGMLKENFYVAKSMMKPLSLGYQKIDMCPNFCILYYFENAELTECKTCGHSSYKPRTSKEKTLVVHVGVSICEVYIIKEISTFISYYFKSQLRKRINRVARHDDGDEVPSSENLSIFSNLR
jgi:hypothetical protein